MRALMDRLDSASFVRIHRSVIVNIACVRELRPAENGDYRVLLRDGTKLTMSRSHRDAVLSRVGGVALAERNRDA
jgi:two-component system LytT family response regulator